MNHRSGATILLGNTSIDRPLIIASVPCKRGDVPIESIEQMRYTATIPCVPLRDTRAAYGAVFIHHDVQFSPPTAPLFPGRPGAFAMDGQAGAVDNEMDWLNGASPVEQERLERAAASGEGGVVRCWEGEPHH